jgi:hypothetical protein
MKKIFNVLTAVFFTIVYLNVYAQSQEGADYFSGKWHVLVKGTPKRDMKMIFVLDKSNDSISGVVQDTAGVAISTLSKVELQDHAVILYFTARDNDMNLVLKKKDDDHVTGILMDMFYAEGKREKQ